MMPMGAARWTNMEALALEAARKRRAVGVYILSYVQKVKVERVGKMVLKE